MQSYLLALGVLAALCLSTFAATFGRNDAEAIGGSSYVTGTCGCNGVTTILTGVGTSWSPSMAGGIINFLPNEFRQVRRVINSTALELDSTINLPGTSASYTIYYGGFQMSTQTWSSAPTYVGDGQTNTALLNPSNQLNIVGPASSNTGLNLYINDQYASATLLSYAHDNNTHLTFDATFCTSCGSWYSSTANGAQRIHKSSGNLLFEASGPVAAGSSIPSWAVWMNANSAGAVTFPLNSGVKFQTSGGTPTGLNYYEEYSTVLSSTTPCPLSVTVKFTRIGNMITAHIAAPSSACTSTMVNRPYFLFVPDRFFPAGYFYQSPAVVITSGVYGIGSATVRAGGIYIWAATASGNFPIGATVDWPGIILTYTGLYL